MVTRPDLSKRNWKHGHAQRGRFSPEYRVWLGMIDRCTHPSHIGFKYYGARGVTVCARWCKSFAAFLADMGPKPKGFTLDRIDSNGNYEPKNCRWATPSKQRLNQRPQDDRTRVLAGWATRRANGWEPKRDKRGRFA